MSAAEPANGLCDVRVVRNVLIPLSDGTTLASDLHVPDAPGPHPTLISLYPYRKDDVIGSFAAYAQRFFAARGFAHLLVDVRGYGGSGGRRAESFHPLLESADAGEVVEWAAMQDWSDGAVGVWGVSYGGLTALAAGAAQPPHLRAIAPIYPLWDVRSDVIAPGGLPAMLGQYQWSTMMLAQALAPPTFRDRDGRWLGVWRERLARLEADGPEASFWQAHPDADRYWSERVLPLDRIAVPTLLVGGWSDLFPAAVARAYAAIATPRRLLVGPWLHVPPDLAAREPVDWLGILLRFWDEHLRGGPPEEGPPVLAFVQGEGGGWYGSDTWPPAGVAERGVELAAEREVDIYAASPLAGSTAGSWDPFGTGMGYPLDQGPDDALSLTYSSAPVDAPLELAGSPRVELDVERLDGDGPLELVAKLVDLGPEGRAELITSGWARTDGGATAVELWPSAWTLAPSHRLRLSISCADFPRIWPNPVHTVLRVAPPGPRVYLPVASQGFGVRVDPPRPPAVGAAERSPWTVDGGADWRVEHDHARRGIAVTLGGGETIRLPEGGRLALRQQATARAEDAHPDEASVVGEVSIEIDVPGGEHVHVEVRSRAWRNRNVCDGSVSVDGRTFFAHSWRSF